MLILRSADPSQSSSEASHTDHGLAALRDFLISRDLINEAAFERARSAAERTGERLEHVLPKLGLISEADLTAALSALFSIPVMTLAQIPPAPILSELVRPDFMRINALIPIQQDENELIVAITSPFDDEPMRALAYLTERQVSARLLTPGDFEKAYQSLYGQHEGTPDDLARFESESDISDDDVERLRDLASEAPTIRFVNQLIHDAVTMGASDIHVEPTRDAVIVRCRVDGALRILRDAPLEMRAAVSSRLKVMARLDIAERRLPQDGRIKMSVQGVDIDLRVSTIPTAFGEGIVLRILDRSRVELDFPTLGFERDQIGVLQELIKQPNGIVLVTGPTGSGKTTTLYTALKSLISTERKLFTVEDPIEYQLHTVSQLQVHPAIGLDFPRALRSILRQDPDIIMIGEIRDLETARIAVQASLTGHLVFSTLHTNSAAATITRLVDMGIEAYLLASTLRAVLAQRLVRRLCKKCRTPHPRASEWSSAIRAGVPTVHEIGEPKLYEARGCHACGHSGYAGRTTIAELMVVNGEIEGLVHAGASEAVLERTARARGMIGLHDAGLTKAWRGETSVEEVLSVVGQESRQ